MPASVLTTFQGTAKAFLSPWREWVRLGWRLWGGLIVSQMLTLYIMPVSYGYLDRLGKWAGRGWTSQNENSVQAE